MMLPWIVVIVWVWAMFLVTAAIFGVPSFGWTMLLSLPAAWWANEIERASLPREGLEAAALNDLNAHIVSCRKGCSRDADGWADYGRLCTDGQRLVRRYIDAAD